MLKTIFIVFFCGVGLATNALNSYSETWFYQLCQNKNISNVRCLGGWNKSEKEGGEHGDCFKHQNCTKAAAIEFEQTHIVVHLLSTTSEEYISIGFSDDLKMGHDAVVSCIFGESAHKHDLQYSFNMGLSSYSFPHYREPLEKIELEAFNLEGGVRYCRFKLFDPVQFANRIVKSPEGNTCFQILVVSGALKGDGSLGHHHGHVLSDKPWKVSSATTFAVSILLMFATTTFNRFM